MVPSSKYKAIGLGSEYKLTSGPPTRNETVLEAVVKMLELEEKRKRPLLEPAAMVSVAGDVWTGEGSTGVIVRPLTVGVERVKRTALTLPGLSWTLPTSSLIVLRLATKFVVPGRA
jgi:hypothetical protein